VLPATVAVKVPPTPFAPATVKLLSGVALPAAVTTLVGLVLLLKPAAVDVPAVTATVEPDVLNAVTVVLLIADPVFATRMEELLPNDDPATALLPNVAVVPSVPRFRPEPATVVVTDTVP
jgi:hypothetical protein